MTFFEAEVEHFERSGRVIILSKGVPHMYIGLRCPPEPSHRKPTAVVGTDLDRERYLFESLVLDIFEADHDIDSGA